MKCPICGKEEFYKLDEAVCDQYAYINGDCYVCIECGYVVWFNKGVADGYKRSLARVKEIENIINDKKQEISRLEKEVNNVDSYKVDLEKYKKELKQRTEWGEKGSPKCRALEECIKETENIINKGVNVNTNRTIAKLKDDIRDLEQESKRTTGLLESNKMPF